MADHTHSTIALTVSIGGLDAALLSLMSIMDIGAAEATAINRPQLPEVIGLRPHGHIVYGIVRREQDL